MMQGDPGNLLKLLQQHMIWYPLMELRDIYKLIYQGVLGAEHLLSSPEEFIHHLRSELQYLQPDQNQAILEPVRSDQMLFRLNLCAYKSRQVSIDPLFHPLIETAHLNTGSKTDLLEVWSAFGKLYEQGHIGEFKTSAIFGFSKWLEEMGFPAVHHSEIYRREYQPAYRLISSKYIPELGLMDAG
jgi:hypothetical protein